MRLKTSPFAIVLSGIGMFAVPQAVRAQGAVSQWDWKPTDYSCNIEHLTFSSDATVWLTFREEGTTDMDEGTWSLNGANLEIKYSNRFPDERLAGTYAKESLRLAHSWKSRDGSAHSETCNFTLEPTEDQLPAGSKFYVVLLSDVFSATPSASNYAGPYASKAACQSDGDVFEKRAILSGSMYTCMLLKKSEIDAIAGAERQKLKKNMLNTK